MSCSRKVALVTGASRGIGRGIALALAKQGAAVYITGRARPRGPRSVEATAEEVTRAARHGGRCTALVCDHGDDEATERVVRQVFAAEGRVDVLVNNAFSGADSSDEIGSLKFWERPLDHWDTFHRVGLRSHYVSTVLCTREWLARSQQALVVNISSAAGLSYVFDVAYAVGKAAVDRLTADCAQELKGSGVTVVAVWPGAVATEIVSKSLEGAAQGRETAFTKTALSSGLESVEFCGRGVAALAADPGVAALNGRVVLTPELAELYGFTDVDGKIPWTFLKKARQAMAAPPRMWRAVERQAGRGHDAAVVQPRAKL